MDRNRMRNNNITRERERGREGRKQKGPIVGTGDDSAIGNFNAI